MKESETNIEGYKSTRVFMAPNGELVMALPIMVDQTEAIMDEALVNSITGVTDISFRVCQQVGYIIYHPDFGEFVWNTKAKDLFIDLGEL